MTVDRESTQTLHLKGHGLSIALDVPRDVLDGFRNAEAAGYQVSLNENNSAEICNSLRYSIPAQFRPPSVAQTEFAKSLAEQLNIEIPERALTLARECSIFINEGKEKLQLSKDTKKFAKTCMQRAKKLARSAKMKEMLDSGSELSSVAELHSLKPATVEKHLEELSAFKLEREKSDGLDRDEYDLIVALVMKIQNGEDINETFYARLSA